MPTDPGQPVPPIERLVQDARADAGPPRRGRRGEAYTALDNINRWMEATGISNGHLARMVGVSPSVMSQVRHRSYPGDSAGIIEKAEGGDRRMVPPPKRTTWATVCYDADRQGNLRRG